MNTWEMLLMVIVVCPKAATYAMLGSLCSTILLQNLKIMLHSCFLHPS